MNAKATIKLVRTATWRDMVMFALIIELSYRHRTRYVLLLESGEDRSVNTFDRYHDASEALEKAIPS